MYQKPDGEYTEDVDEMDKTDVLLDILEGIAKLLRVQLENEKELNAELLNEQNDLREQLAQIGAGGMSNGA